MRPSQAKVDADAVMRELCERSFSHFLRLAWPNVIPDGYIHNWHMDAIGEHLEAVADGQITRLLVNVPPGTSKSTAIGVMYPAWLWGPKGQANHKYIGAAHEQGLAVRDARMMRELVTSPWFQNLWPIALAGDQNEKLYFENEQRGFRQACAVASMTGRRGHTIAWDDPLSPEKAYSDTHRETAIRVLTETLPTRLSDPKTSAIIVVMQRLHENDPSGYILANGLGYEHLCLPMEYEVGRSKKTSIGWADPRTEEGELLFPDRFPREVVDRDKKIMGPNATAGQFQQRPVPADGGDFDISKILLVDALPAGLKFVRGWDFAATTNKTSDFTASTKMAIDKDGVTWIADAQAFKARPDGVEARLIQTAQLDGRDTKQSLPLDPGQAGVAQESSLSKKLQGIRFEFSRESGDKRARAMPFAAQVNAGNVRLLNGLPDAQEFLHQLAAFPLGAHDDVVDSSSRAYNDLISGSKSLLSTKRLF